jgi:hypothetical protein
VVVVAASMADPRAAEACGCPINRPPPCQAAWAADAVFSGTVRSIDMGPNRETVVRFDIEQPFLNVPSGPVEIVNDESCNYRFTPGTKYVVYARRNDDGRLTTDKCSRTKPLTEAGEDLKYLSALPAAGTGARVVGRVNEWVHHPADDHGVDYGPLENMTVSIHGAGLSRDVVTDRNGEYELRGVPLGPVSISVVTPFGSVADGLREFKVTDLRACIAADFTVRTQAAVHGLVVDEAGRPLSGIPVEALAAELAGYEPATVFLPETTDNRGRFSFDYLPPGRYVFGLNVTKGRYKPPSGPATFLPGTAVAKDAAVFDLKPGDRTDVGVLGLTSR